MLSGALKTVQLLCAERMLLGSPFSPDAALTASRPLLCICTADLTQHCCLAQLQWSTHRPLEAFRLLSIAAQSCAGRVFLWL